MTDSESPASAEPAPGTLGAILAKTSKGMADKLAEIREGLDHGGEKGGATEEIVAEFLADRLPQSIRATSGQVMDRTGRKSGQVDVILYDATRTPMLFASTNAGRHTVPAEGVLAVVEIKTHLNPAEVQKSVSHAQTVKTLLRDSYLPRPIEVGYNMYGKHWTTPPILYSVFAFEGDGLYADALNDSPHHDLPLEQRIDNMVVLDRGVCVSGELTITDPSGKMNPESRFSATPTPTSTMVNCPTPNALAVWYGLLTGVVSQFVGGAPIDMTRYLESELSLTGQFGQKTPAAMAFRTRVEQEFADIVGLPQELLHRFATRQPLSLEEQYDLVTNPNFTEGDPPPGTDPAVAEAGKVIREAARTMSKPDWLSFVAHLQQQAPTQDIASPSEGAGDADRPGG